MPGASQRVLLIGGTSEIGLAILAAMKLPAGAELLLAGRDTERMRGAAAAAGLLGPGGLPGRLTLLRYDATDPQAHGALVRAAVAGGPLDVVISAAGVLTPQDKLDGDPAAAGLLVGTNFTSHVTVLLGLAAQMRQAGHGLIVILSSVAAVRPRRANFVYGSAKAGLDAFGRGLADSLHGSGARVLLVRPGFVIGRMTAGMPAAPLSSTPDQVGAAVAAAIAAGPGRTPQVLWVPRPLAGLAAAMRLIPRPLWRRLAR